MLSQWVSGDLELDQELRAGKVPVCIREDYILYLEFFKGNLWLHVEIKKWSSEVKKNGLKDIALIEYLTGTPIVALIREDDIKLVRFAKSFGWSEKCQISLLDGSKAFIYTNKV
jgi:hypothetical protein